MRRHNRVTEARKRLEARLRLRMLGRMTVALQRRRKRGYCDGLMNSEWAAMSIGWQHVIAAPRVHGLRADVLA